MKVDVTKLWFECTQKVDVGGAGRHGVGDVRHGDGHRQHDGEREAVLLAALDGQKEYERAEEGKEDNW